MQSHARQCRQAVLRGRAPTLTRIRGPAHASADVRSLRDRVRRRAGMGRVLAAAVVIIAAMAAAPAARAAVVSAVDNDFISTLEYDAGAGESNQVDATYALDPGGDYAVTIKDRGAIITTTTPLGVSGTGCVPTSLHQAVCHYRRNSVHSAGFQLGDRGDTFTPHGLAEDFSLFGGAGNDRLTGGTGSNYYEPGTGSDQVIGAAGFDWVSYADHTAPVSITVD